MLCKGAKRLWKRRKAAQKEKEDAARELDEHSAIKPGDLNEEEEEEE
jgi:hypothetical protein